jgi:predicted DNA-binding WGR domain protein
MTISKHAEEFAGKPIRDYHAAVGILAPVLPRREFHFQEGSSNKFWAIELDGTRHTVQFGRLGTAGQAQTKKFKTPEEAQQSYAKLVAEKVAKGYTLAPPAAGAATKAKGKSAPPPVAYRLRLDYDDFEAKSQLTDVLATFLADPAAASADALVLGCWSFEGDDSAALVEALVAARDQLPNLRALFLGDITYEEQEISWIHQTDVSPLFEAYPKLEHFRVRGGEGLTLGRLRHANLKALVIETGGLPTAVVREVAAAELPKLEHLELWLGDEGYGGDAAVEDLAPILSGKQFPKLRYLGLRDSAKADEVAAAVAKAPVLKKVKVLDLSLGNLSDAGAEALAASPLVAKLEKLDIHHHYVSPAVVKKLKALGPQVNAGDVKKPDEYDDEVVRYIAVAE